MRPEINADYLGLHLSSPVIVGACTITRQPESVRELAIAGAGAVVLPSLFQEQIVNYMLRDGVQPDADEERAEAAGSSHIQNGYNGGPAAYLRTIGELKHCVGIPIIANLNGFTDGQWLSFARELEDAGVDAIELSLYTDCANPGQSADEIEAKLIDCVAKVTDCVSIPISVKLTPHFTSLANLAWRLVEVGVSGIVIFAHEPVWETHLDRLAATTNWSLTPSGNVHPTVAGLIRIRRGGPRVSIAASGGVSNPGNLIQVVLAGADVAMVTSEIYRGGPDVIAHMIDGIRSYLERAGLDSFQALTQARPDKADPIDQRLDLLKSLTQDGRYHDPTPPLPTDHVGDRWGHIQR